ncbi:hypothetical protein SUDANB140_02312 [Streptomyces sp. enrichment culture]
MRLLLGEGRLDDALAADPLLVRAGDAVFLAADLAAVLFLAAALCFAALLFLAALLVEAAFFAVAFAPAAFFAVALFAAAFVAVAFAPAAFVAVALFAAAFVAVADLAVPFRAAADPAAADSLPAPAEEAPPPRDEDEAPFAAEAAPFAREEAPSACPFPRGCVSQATAAPVAATGHSTSPATPSTPAPVYTITRRPRGDTAPIRSNAPSAALPTVPAPGTFRSAEAAACNGLGSVCADFCSAMTVRPRPVRAVETLGTSPSAFRRVPAPRALIPTAFQARTP